MHIHERMKDCISACHDCHDVCKATLFDHCLREGGKHAEPHHIGVMADCMDICHTTANFMLRRSEHHALLCGACAIVCDSCAESCDAFDTEEMQFCAQACRACAKMCREMSADAYIPGTGQSAEHHVDHVM